MDSKPIGCSTKNNSDQAELKVEINKMQPGEGEIRGISQRISLKSPKKPTKARGFLSKTPEKQAKNHLL